MKVNEIKREGISIWNIYWNIKKINKRVSGGLRFYRK